MPDSAPTILLLLCGPCPLAQAEASRTVKARRMTFSCELREDDDRGMRSVGELAFVVRARSDRASNGAPIESCMSEAALARPCRRFQVAVVTWSYAAPGALNARHVDCLMSPTVRRRS